MIKIKQVLSISQISLSLSLNLIPFNIGQLGNKPDAIIRRDYELRVRGPATLDAGALDIYACIN
jgi:hypothetical protein